MTGGGDRSSICKLPTGSLEVYRWLEISSIHDQENVFDDHENASEMTKVEAKLVCCLLQTEKQTDQVPCMCDTRWLQGKSREE